MRCKKRSSSAAYLLMIQTIITYQCPNCGSQNLVNNGHDYKGAQKYHCKDRMSYCTLDIMAQRQQIDVIIWASRNMIILLKNAAGFVVAGISGEFRNNFPSSTHHKMTCIHKYSSHCCIITARLQTYSDASATHSSTCRAVTGPALKARMMPSASMI